MSGTPSEPDESWRRKFAKAFSPRAVLVAKLEPFLRDALKGMTVTCKNSLRCLDIKMLLRH